MALYEVHDNMRGTCYVEADSLTEVEQLVEPSYDEFMEELAKSEDEDAQENAEESWQLYLEGCRVVSVELLTEHGVIRAETIKLRVAR